MAIDDGELLDAYSAAVTSVAERVGPAVCALSVRNRGPGSGVVLSADGMIVAYVAPLVEPTLASKDTGIFSFSWAPRVLRMERPLHEMAGVRDGLVDYHIKSDSTGALVAAPEADEYFPVFFSSSLLTGSAFGIDLLDGGLRQAALKQLIRRSEGKPVDLGRARLD